MKRWIETADGVYWIEQFDGLYSDGRGSALRTRKTLKAEFGIRRSGR